MPQRRTNTASSRWLRRSIPETRTSKAVDEPPPQARDDRVREELRVELLAVECDSSHHERTRVIRKQNGPLLQIRKIGRRYFFMRGKLGALIPDHRAQPQYLFDVTMAAAEDQPTAIDVEHLEFVE